MKVALNSNNSNPNPNTFVYYPINFLVENIMLDIYFTRYHMYNWYSKIKKIK